MVPWWLGEYSVRGLLVICTDRQTLLSQTSSVELHLVSLAFQVGDWAKLKRILAFTSPPNKFSFRVFATFSITNIEHKEWGATMLRDFIGLIQNLEKWLFYIQHCLWSRILLGMLILAMLKSKSWDWSELWWKFSNCNSCAFPENEISWLSTIVLFLNSGHNVRRPESRQCGLCFTGLWFPKYNVLWIAFSKKTLRSSWHTSI